MTKTWMMILLLALGGAACATTGQSATASASDSNLVVLPDGTRLICVMEATTGSHIRERVCHRETQSAAQKEANRQFIDRPAVQLSK